MKSQPKGGGGKVFVTTVLKLVLESLTMWGGGVENYTNFCDDPSIHM